MVYLADYLDWTIRNSYGRKKMKATDSVAIVSGGLDSTVLVYDMLAQGYTPHILSFNYGQRHKKELGYAADTAKRLDLPHDIIDLTGLTHLISNSALTSSPIAEASPFHLGDYDEAGGRKAPEHDIEVPEGHYGEESMKQTVVPNRNMIMIAIATGIAINEKAQRVGLGVHAGDHFVYPDCRPAFVNQMDLAILVGNDGFHSFPVTSKQTRKPEGFEPSDKRASGEKYLFGSVETVEEASLEGPLYTPFLHKTKAAIAYRALELGVPLHATWSCYKGEEIHCGRCGTCVERLEAIDEATQKMMSTFYGTPQNPGSGIAPYDATQYADTEFWRTQVGK